MIPPVPTDPLLGTAYHAIGALSSSACYAPQKKVRNWSWQTYWLTQAAFCWFLLPIAGAALTIPHLLQVLKEGSTCSRMRGGLKKADMLILIGVTYNNLQERKQHVHELTLPCIRGAWLQAQED